MSSAPRTRKSASAYKEARAPAPPTAAAKKKDVSADDYKAQHKKQAAARRAAAEQLSSADALRSLQVTRRPGARRVRLRRRAECAVAARGGGGVGAKADGTLRAATTRTARRIRG